MYRGALLLLVVLCGVGGTNTSDAQERAAPTASPNALPRPNGTLAVELDGRTLSGDVRLQTPVAERGAARIRRVEAAGRTLLELRVGQRRGGRSEVWIGEVKGEAVEALWSGIVGPLDADGETSIEVELSPRGLLRFQSAGRITRCDGRAARLFPESWNFEARAWIPAAPEPATAAKVRLEAKRGGTPPASGPAAFSFSAASASPGAAGARALVPPSGLNDGRLETAWTVGPAGDGRGEWVTARASGEQSVVGLSIAPGDARDLASFRAAARPTRLLVVYGTKDDERVEVELREDEDGGGRRWRTPFWVAFPRPLPTSCVSVFVTAVEPGRAGAPMAISDLRLATALDGPEGPARAVAALAAAPACDARVAAVVGFGGRAIEPLVAALSGPKSQGRICLVEALGGVLADQPPEAAPPALDNALKRLVIDASDDEERGLSRAVRRLGDDRLAAFATALGDEQQPDEARLRVARLLGGAAEREQARSALLAALGRPPAALRSEVRRALAAGAVPTAALIDEYARASTDQPARRADLLFVIGARAAAEPRQDGRARRVLEEALAPGAPFEVQGRAIGGLGRLAREDEGAAARLAAVRAEADEPMLRLFATEELARNGGAAVLPALRAAVSDRDPRVREAAALALGRRRDTSAAPLLVGAAKQEPWPTVRRAEVAALGELCVPAGNDLLVRAAERDLPAVRKAAFVALARCRDGRAPKQLADILERAEEDPELRILAANLLGELKDASAAPVLARQAHAAADQAAGDPGLEGVAIASIRALGTLRAPETSASLQPFVTDPRPSLRRATAEALGHLCDRRAVATLAEAEGDRDDGVAAAARAARRRCSGASSRRLR